MLSRVADAIYWMCRYIERAENVARFIDVNLHLNLDLQEPAGRQQWAPLVTITGDQAVFRERYGEASAENVIRFLTFDRGYPNSILACLLSARENARMVREIISSEMWEQLNRSFLMVTAAAQHTEPAALSHEFFERVKMASHLFTGLTEATMSHGEPWHFAQLGRLLERADKTSRILDVKYFILLPKIEYVGTPYDNIQWAAVLKSVSALEMYRKQYRRIHPEQVADFLLFDRSFPRAVRYCLSRAQACLCAISGSQPDVFCNEAERRLGRLRSELDYADIQEVFRIGMHEYIDRLQTRLNEVGAAIAGAFFVACEPRHRPAPAGRSPLQ
ncbi:MAG: alpha-E domain-containing protein [Desulfobacterales bacterium]|jgi:uncharacterized alpha-E superfamily protein|nr:alpha-E domain-containing protein [Desulfobacterales bacterium]